MSLKTITGLSSVFFVAASATTPFESNKIVKATSSLDPA
jgi:hypothetical protein